MDPRGAAAARDDVARARALAIPPAWTDVWICRQPNGHIQATGLDDAGRRQYIYHEAWRAKQDRLKHDHVLEFAARLPALRKEVAQAMDTPGLNRDRVLGSAVRLLDLGLFRVGSEQYAQSNGTFGLATLRREHVASVQGGVLFTYRAKGGAERTQHVSDPQVVAVIRALRRRRAGGDRLLAYFEGGDWHDVHSDELNAHLKDLIGLEATAKDFRTWHATVLTAVGLAVSQEANPSATSRRRAVARAVAEAADYLGNTPAVCRASYIDGRVIDRYQHGETIDAALPVLGRDTPDGVPATHGAAEKAVLRLLRG